MTGCEKDNKKEDCSGDAAFCAFIDRAAYNDAGLVIDEHLNGQKEDLSNTEKLKQLQDWLTCKSCISHVEMVCNSCIDTNPAQSELKVTCIVNGQQVEKILDVIMDKPLRIRTFHDWSMNKFLTIEDKYMLEAEGLAKIRTNGLLRQNAITCTIHQNSKLR